MRQLSLAAALATALLSATNADVIAAERKQTGNGEFFESKIRPVLVKHCYQCHSTKAKSVKGGLLLDSRDALRKGGESGPTIVAGKPAESLLVAALKYDGLEMPPKGKLAKSVVKDFEHWIASGAFDPRTKVSTTPVKKSIDYQAALEFWSFQAPKKSPLPATNHAWVRNDIDRFVLTRLLRNKLRPSPQADPRTLLRRLSFDITGLPPTPTQIDAFLKKWNADASQAYEQAVERLLKSKQYGERWARHWLDVARYGEDQAHTFKARRYPRGFLYRDWVVNSLNEDLPYDQFLMAQIAGDLMPSADRHERIAALGLFALGPVYYAENVEKDKATADEWDDRVDTLMRGVQGLTASCARCHDHKYDPISMTDYYGLAGVFASSQYREQPIASPETLARKEKANGEADKQKRDIDLFLREQARAIRPALVADIPKYLTTAWKVKNQEKSKKKLNKKSLAAFAKSAGTNVSVLQRWLTALNAAKKTPDKFDFLSEYLKLVESQDAKRDLSTDAASIKAVEEVGQRLAAKVQTILPQRKQLFARFGENAAFVRPQDKATVEPGMIPLGNLFDDSSQVPLDAALATDRFKAEATANSLGVDRVAYGFGQRKEIAPGVSFDFRKLGSDSATYGKVTNDAWSHEGGISTTGKRRGGSGRMEQGIGMHANALISFDLDEIRKAGLMRPNQQFDFVIDRAGINDDSIGAQSSAYLAVIVSRPHRNKTETDAILAAQVNGQPMEIATDDFTYYFASQPPQPFKADGKTMAIKIRIPAEAKHLTIASLGAGAPAENTISSDHVVLSGARLEMNPRPKPKATANNNNANGAESQNPNDRAHAVLLSRFLYDDGLLAVSAAEVATILSAEPAKQLTAMKARHEQLKKAAASIEVPLAHSLADGSSRDLPIYIQGNPAKKGQIAPRGLPAILTSGKRKPFASSGSGRLELARAIASPSNPLTARVIVNRVWSHYFGHGLVRTPSNFGKLGDRPTHPALLDHLSVRFMEEGWSLKWLHRQILQSATYQQSSEFDAARFEADPENKLLWRQNRRRLAIEPWRDGLLAVSGELDTTMGGASSKLDDTRNKRRTLYGFISRHRLNELLRLFDFPDPNITSAKRTTTTVPLQQLFVLNSEFMMQRATALTSRLHKEHPASDDKRIQKAYLLLYGRNATSEEVIIGRTFLSQEQPDKKAGLNHWQQYALALLSANEFLYLD